jgi:PIN domain nuclease of toxin-antitoxin system
VIVLDAYAVLALLKGEPAADEVAQLLARDEQAALTVLGVAEVVDHLVRLVGADEDDAVLDVAQLGLAAPLPLDAGLALRSGLLRSRHYHRKNRAVSLADCVAAETARPAGSLLATADSHLLDMCREEGVAVVPLRDTNGHVWAS